VVEPEGSVSVVIRKDRVQSARMSSSIAPPIADEDLRVRETALESGSESNGNHSTSATPTAWYVEDHW
jgi:hypothetical protein